MIYLDNAATTPISKEVLDEMMPYLTDNFGNPSSLHSVGRKAKKAIEKARNQAANAINASPEQIIFTSGATESNNIVRLFAKKYKLSYTNSPFEHPSNYSCLSNCDGDIHSVMYVNNETGNIILQKSMIDAAHKSGKKIHSDFTQAFGHLPINVKELDVDFASFSGHKIFAPKGVGVLYIKNPKTFPSIQLWIGGGQEHGYRHGTENVAGIVGLGMAFELYNYDKDIEKRNYEKRRQLINELSDVEDMIINTDLDNSIATTLSLSFKGLEGEALMLLLDNKGVCVSAGSACHSGSLEPSRVLKAMGVPEEYINGTIRISFTLYTSTEDLIRAAKKIKECVKILRGY